MGLKSKVRTHTVTTNATLTTRGREILSREGKIDVTKFILSDEEIDYTLWDNTHPGGTKHYGRVLEDTPLLEATPNRTKFNSQILPDETGDYRSIDWNISKEAILPLRARYQINIPTLHYPRASWEALIGIHPTSTQRILVHDSSVPEWIDWYKMRTTDLSEKYIFTIENTNVVRFTQYREGSFGMSGNPWLKASDIPGSGDTIEATEIGFQPQQINPKAATTITVQGKISEITKVVSIQVVPKDDTDVFAGASPVDVTDPKFY